MARLVAPPVEINHQSNTLRMRAGKEELRNNYVRKRCDGHELEVRTARGYDSTMSIGGVKTISDRKRSHNNPTPFLPFRESTLSSLGLHNLYKHKQPTPLLRKNNSTRNTNMGMSLQSSGNVLSV